VASLSPCAEEGVVLSYEWSIYILNDTQTGTQTQTETQLLYPSILPDPTVYSLASNTLTTGTYIVRLIATASGIVNGAVSATEEVAVTVVDGTVVAVITGMSSNPIPITTYTY
jgi:hypothetical protein